MSAEWLNVIIGIAGLILGSVGTISVQMIITKNNNKKSAKTITKQKARDVQGDMIGRDKKIETINTKED